LKEHRDKFYPNNIKVIPYGIYEEMDPIVMAHWIMGDGTYKNG
jgi:hypothetical protein